MSSKKGRTSKNINSTNLYEDGSELRRGPWTLEEDNLLIQYMNSHGEGQWNSLAKSAGLNRTGKSCRLRWLNYLKPDIKRGNLTPHEQLLILELHSRWGNRWSKIAQNLPGRTDNEIKNYWRTRVQKHARQLNVDSASNKFLETVRMYWMPRLLEKMEQDNSSSVTSSPSSSITTLETQNLAAPSPLVDQLPPPCLKSGSVVNNSDDDVKVPEMLCGKSIEDDQCYHVNILSYDMQELESHGINETGADWDDQGSFWDSDELWAI